MERYTDTISGEELYIYTGPAGNKYYYKDQASTMLHRIDGPAIEGANGNKFWYVNGKCHRIDGPAIEYANGAKEWYVDDVLIMRLNKDGKIVERMK